MRRDGEELTWQERLPWGRDAGAGLRAELGRRVEYYSRGRDHGYISSVSPEPSTEQDSIVQGLPWWSDG